MFYQLDSAGVLKELTYILTFFSKLYVSNRSKKQRLTSIQAYFQGLCSVLNIYFASKLDFICFYLQKLGNNSIYSHIF